MRIEVHDPSFEPLAGRFAELNSTSGAVTSLCVYRGGEVALTASTQEARPARLQVLRSVSKAILTVLAGIAMEEGELDVEAPIAEIWPEFAQAGKSQITGRQLLAHQAGLPAFDVPMTKMQVLSWNPAVAQLASQAPRWEPGTAHGYHDLTFGYLVGEWLQRACGMGISELVERRIRVPLDMQLWMGVPMDVLPRVIPLRRSPGSMPSFPPGRDRGLLDESLSNPDLLPLEHSMEYLSVPVPASNAVGDAASVARFFAALVTDPQGGGPLLDVETVKNLARVQSDGPDLVVGWPRRYGTGFMLPDPTRPMGGVQTECFGHYGQGGSLGFAHLETGLAFGFTTDEDKSFLGADPRTEPLAALALACAR